jgi:hypothetical protein
MGQRGLVTLVAGLLTVGSAFAGEILLDFNTDPLAPLAPAYVEDGFQIRRIGASHYHIAQACSRIGLITPCSRDNTLYFGLGYCRGDSRASAISPGERVGRSV